MDLNNLQNVLSNPKVSPDTKHAVDVLYRKSAKITFGKIDSRNEGYIMGEVKLPRCTSVLKMDGTKAGALMEWAKREIVADAKTQIKGIFAQGKGITEDEAYMVLDNALQAPDKQRDQAGDAGTAVHDNIENWLNGKPCITDERLLEFQYIWETEKVIPVATELPVVWYEGETNKGFGGRLDILAYDTVNDKFILYDNKTSKSVHQGYALQCSAYIEAIKQMTDGLLNVSDAKIIHLPDLAKLSSIQLKAHKKYGKLITLKDLDVAWKHYECLLEQYYMRNNKYF